MFMNKQNSLKVQREAYDLNKQLIWKWAEKKTISKEKAERMLVNLDNSMKYNEQMLHDILTGETAEWLIKIREDKTVLLGHQAQAIYFSLTWDDIHKLSKDIKEYESNNMVDEKSDKHKGEDHHHDDH